MEDLDRLILARELMGRVTKSCRSNSKLPQLVELFLSRPLVKVPLAAKVSCMAFARGSAS